MNVILSKSNIRFPYKNIWNQEKKASAYEQGCQMVYIKTKNSNLGKICMVFHKKMSEYCMTIWSILRPFGIFVAILMYVMVIWYIFPLWYVVRRKIWQPCI
jgi:hypothetical protein